MTADEMFEELGYNKSEYDNSIVFDKRLIEIYFFKAEKTFCGVEAIKQLNKVKEIFEHLKYHGWINDIKKDTDASIEAIDTILSEFPMQNS